MVRHVLASGRIPANSIVIVFLLASTAMAAVESGGTSSASAEAYEKAIEPAEVLVGQWDFSGALSAMAKLTFQGQADADRLASRRDEVKRLASLKAKIIEKACKSKPWLKRGLAAVPGSGGKVMNVGIQIIAAKEDGVTITETTARSKRTGDKPWAKLNDREVAALLKATVSANSADDQLAAGLLCLARSDTTAAGDHFESARALGAKTDRYLASLAAISFKEAKNLLKEGKLREAAAALKAIENRYADTTWLNLHKEEVAATRDQIVNAEADALYAQAVSLFKGGKARYPALKRLLQRLKEEYPSSIAVTDETRTPSVVEMQMAVEGRKLIKVSQSGDARFKRIQDAIKAAPPRSVIEIQDSASYPEEIILPADKKGLTLRGKHGLWPVIRCPGRDSISIRSPDATVTKVIVVGSVLLDSKSASVQEAVISGELKVAKKKGNRELKLDSCFVVGFVGGDRWSEKTLSARNSFLGNRIEAHNVDFENVLARRELIAYEHVQLKSCNLLGGVRCQAKQATILDSILTQVAATQKGVKIEHCDVFGKGYLLLAKPGKGCLTKDPLFRDPESFDYRLKQDSPCLKKASDGGDIGIRQTPEMERILKKALELRSQGVITF